MHQPFYAEIAGVFISFIVGRVLLGSFSFAALPVGDKASVLPDAPSALLKRNRGLQPSPARAAARTD